VSSSDDGSGEDTAIFRKHDRNTITGRENIPKNEGSSLGGIAGGVAVLTVSNLLVKAAGLLFKIPMNHIIGDSGMGYYGSAYSVYTFFYMLATSGLPIAVSVMVAERRAGGRIVSAKLVYRLALAIFVLIGSATSAFMLFGADTLAGAVGSEKSAMCIMTAAPTMLFVCAAGALRGYFQGCGNMVPTAVSQLIEAVGKLGIGITAALYAISRGYAIHIVAAYAVSGLTVGSLLGAVYLLAVRIIRGDRDLVTDSSIDYRSERIRDILRHFCRISLPVTISASVMSLTNMLDTAMIQRILTDSMTAEEAAAVYGNYTSLAVPMFNLPPVFVYPIAYALVPKVAAAVSEERSRQVENALRYAVAVALPCTLGLTVLADPILCLLYSDASAHTASPLLVCLAPSSFFVCMLAVTNSVLQACGQERKPVVSMICGGAVKCVAGVILLREYGIAGAPVSTFLCYLTATVLNFAFTAKSCRIKLNFPRVFLRPLAAGVSCALTALLCEPVVGCIPAIIAAAAVYGAVLLITGAVTGNEIRAVLDGKFNKDVNKNYERKNQRIKE